MKKYAKHVDKIIELATKTVADTALYLDDTFRPSTKSFIERRRQMITTYKKDCMAMEIVYENATELREFLGPTLDAAFILILHKTRRDIRHYELNMQEIYNEAVASTYKAVASLNSFVKIMEGDQLI